MENSELIDDILPNVSRSIDFSDFCQGFSLDPFSKVINSDNYVAIISFPFDKGPMRTTSHLAKGHGI